MTWIKNKKKRDEVINALGALVIYHRIEPLIDRVQMMYIEALAKFDHADVMESMGCDAALKWFPKIPDLTDYIQGSPNSRQALAWASLLKSIDDVGAYDSVIFEDSALGAAVDGMGGWVELCDHTYEKLRFRRKEFESLYLAHLNVRGEPRKFMGLIESHNIGAKNRGIDVPDGAFRLITVPAANVRAARKPKMIEGNGEPNE